MTDRQNIQIDFVTQTGGDRLLRLSEAQSGLLLEKKLDPQRPGGWSEGRTSGRC